MITIKEITPEDNLLEIIGSIKSALWSKNSEINPSDYSIEGLRTCILSEHNIFCVALLDGQFAGMASAYFLHKPDGDIWLYVDEVDVCSDKQRNGVGTALMQYLFKYGEDNKCEELWLGTEKDNVAANALYTSLKPTEIEDFVGYNYKVD